MQPLSAAANTLAVSKIHISICILFPSFLLKMCLLQLDIRADDDLELDSPASASQVLGYRHYTVYIALGIKGRA